MDINEFTSRFMTDRLRRGSLCAALAGFLLGSAACGGEELEQRDLGNTENQLAAAEDAGPDRTPLVVDGVIDPFIVGHWVGHAEDPFSPSAPDGERPDYRFPSGSTDISLDLSIAEDISSPYGEITFGSGPAPQPQPRVAYPPGFEPAFPAIGSALPLAPVEGFAYPLAEAIWRTTGDTGIAAGALALGYLPNAAYAQWCGLQPAREVAPGVFDCANPTDDPSARCAREYADGSKETYDCATLNLCQAANICSCSQNGCEASAVTANQLWLIRDGDELLVSFVGAVFDYGSTAARFLPVGTARFRRVAE